MEACGIPVPNYELEEGNSDITLKVCAPLCRPNYISVSIERKTITFDAHPYFLRLKLPCSVEHEANFENFDENTGIYTLVLKKNSENVEDSDSECEEEDLLHEFIHESNNLKVDETFKKPCYGFLNMYFGKFGQYFGEFSQVIDLPDPDKTVVEDRIRLKQKDEDEKWSEDHYLADLMDNELFQSVFSYVPQWFISENRELNKEEKDILNDIQKPLCSLDGLTDVQKESAKFQMIDILLAFCYNKRTTEGENTVESAWTINKLSSSLSWFEDFVSLKAVILSFYRRSLTFPLYRNWELSKLIQKDVIALLRSGYNEITRCFIETKELFEESENRYILNTLYIGPLCHFSYSLNQEVLNQMAEEMEKIEIFKWEIQKDLILLEVAAKMVVEEDERVKEDDLNQIDRLTGKISALNVFESNRKSIQDSECSSSSSESESESNSSDSDDS